MEGQSGMNEMRFPDLFSRSLKVMSSKQPGRTTMLNDNQPIYYKYNSYGYRSEEFKDQSVLVLGCSQTLGVGLPLEYTWPFLLSKKTNMPYISLAKGGDSMQAQVIKAFQFFKEFYHPEYIFGVFPMARMEMPYVKDVFGVNKKPNISEKEMDYIQNIFINNSKIEKFSKLPHSADEVIPEEVPIFYNLMFMQMLEQYCKTNNINLFWTAYNDTSYSDLHNRIDMESYFLGDFIYDGNDKVCHEGHAGNLFDFAADDKLGHPHWGLHQQIHLAESFHSML
jgi:hypothetical protein